MERLVWEEQYICRDRTHHRPVPKGLASFRVVDVVVQLWAYPLIAASLGEVDMAMVEGLL
jgi:hypothetical protein